VHLLATGIVPGDSLRPVLVLAFVTGRTRRRLDGTGRRLSKQMSFRFNNHET
jgi:hypothetical protein